MREEYELEVLERYDLEVKSTRRIRGAFFCDTNEGTMLLKETKISGRRAPFLYLVLSAIEERGNVKVDTPVFTRDGELLVTSGDGSVYMLKKWYQGRETDIRQESEIARAAVEMAKLHSELRQGVTGTGRNGTVRTGQVCDVQVRDGQERNRQEGNTQGDQVEIPVVPAGRDPVEEIRRHNRELKKVRAFVRGRVAKNEFEYLFLDSFEKMYCLAEAVLLRMENSSASELFEESVRCGYLVHGDYNYHNLLMLRDGMAVTNFEHMRVDIQVRDLYYFMRKVMEKNHWKLKIGQRILESYESVRRLSDEEREYVGLCLAYPEKYWKTASTYYHSNKAWLPEKYVEKLEIAVRQNEEKSDFLKKIFHVTL